SPIAWIPLLFCWSLYRLIAALHFLLFFFFQCVVDLLDLHSFPTRRSSDLYSNRLFLYTFFGLYADNSVLHEFLLIQKFIYLLFRSEEHTSELQSRFDLVCRLLLEKKK